ncbi:MAG TPA: hypothetical protein VGC20_15465 [bacterium]|jgi:alkylhydroperoxidase family enzyme
MSALHAKPKDDDQVWHGVEGLVAALMRQALEDALGHNTYLLATGGSKVTSQTQQRAQAAARAWLCSDACEAMVAACGADPAVIREALQRRYEWMRP